MAMAARRMSKRDWGCGAVAGTAPAPVSDSGVDDE